MWISDISILNFKNIQEASLEFCPSLNCVVGANGMGKSNLLEAVYYLSMTRTFLRLTEPEVIRHGADAMMVSGRYDMESGRTETVSIGYQPPRHKVLRRGGKECKRLADHIGTLPIVLISPHDHFIITGAPEERRRLMDMVISQGDSAYMEALMRYNNALSQRNSMLRAERYDPLLMESVELQMEMHATLVYERRAAWVKEITPSFQKYYKSIAGSPEAPGMDYSSVLASISLTDALARNRHKDEVLGYTGVGPHRDDLRMMLGGSDLKRIGSQGQIKTYTIALRMAIFEYLQGCRALKPLLLLDDIFDKLDAGRVANIMNIVSSSECFGQIFITDTGRENIDAILRGMDAPYRLFEADNGSFILINH